MSINSIFKPTVFLAAFLAGTTHAGVPKISMISAWKI